MKNKIPVTVITGYLGAGKTTLLNNILHGDHGRKIAVIVNDMGQVNVDAALVNQGGFKQTEEKLVPMSNGCICCTLREDLIFELDKIAALGNIEQIVIEASGVSEPIPIAQSVALPDNPLGIDLTDKMYIDAIISVVDANRFRENFPSGSEILKRKEQGDVAEEDRDIRDLLIDQIESCNILLLNKCDLLSEEETDKIQRLIKKLQPTAKIIRTVQSNVQLDELLDTQLFDLDEISYSAGWIKELELGFQNHTPETDEYGISSFVYRSRLPFDANKFQAFATKHLPESVTRTKGFIWFAQHSDFSALFETAGSHKSIAPLTYWIATLPKAEKYHLLEQNPEVKAIWHPLYGDRLTEIVFIGMEMDQDWLERQLDDCLVTISDLENKHYPEQSPYPWQHSDLLAVQE